MDRLKIFSLPGQLKADPRGWVFFPFQADPGPAPGGCDPSSLHIVQSLPGAVRGNHYHPTAAEWLYVFGGPTALYWKEDGRLHSKVLDGDDRLVYIPAGVTHTVVNTGAGPVYLVSFRESHREEDHTRPDHIAG